MNILADEIQPDQDVLVLGRYPVIIPTSQVAGEFGINVVHQELTICPNLTVIENILLGKGLTKTERGKKIREAKEIFKSFGVDTPPKAKVHSQE